MKDWNSRKQWIGSGTLRMMLVGSSMLALASCVGTSPQVDVSGIRRVVGTDLIGVRGATAEDQRRVNRTVVGLCQTAAWTGAECAAHGRAVGTSLPAPERASRANVDGSMVPGS